MAFRKDKTTAAQTAANVAGGVAQAAIAKGVIAHADEAAKYAVVVFEALFERLGPVVEADNKVFEAAEGTTTTVAKTSGKSTARKGKTSGGSKRRSGGGGGSVTLEDALGMELNSGAFEGVTLGGLLEIGVDEAEDGYGYGNGERDGRDYIAWLASDTYENDYVQRRARLIADAEGIDY